MRRNSAEMRLIMLNKAKEKLKELAKKGGIYRVVYRNLQAWKKKYTFYRQYYHLPIEENLVVFESFMGKNCSCSPKALYLAMLHDEAYKDFQFIWVINNVKSHAYLNKNRNTKVVKRLSPEFHKAMAQAKYLIFNSGIPAYISLKKEQIYVQTWHGTPLKRLGCDIKIDGSASFNQKEIYKQYRTNGKRFTYLLSPSAFTTKKLSSAFDLSEKRKKEIIVEEGYPRNDALFQFTREQIEQIKKKLKIPEEKKIVLYAPTFRDNNFEFAYGFKYDGGMDFDLLKEQLGEDIVVLFRAHLQIADKFDFSKYKDFIYNVSKYNDINDLYIISDLLITDYSSVFFDYANLKRPIIFYMYDLEQYQNEIRDFYLDLSELPGPIIKEQTELVDQMRELLEQFEYTEKYQKFNEKFNYLDSSNCSNKVLQKIIHL